MDETLGDSDRETVKLQSQTHWARSMEVPVPYRRDGIVEGVLESEAVLYDQQSGCTHRMNESALAVWRACDGQSTTRQLAERLTQVYDVPLETAIHDAEQSIAAFAQVGLVTAVEDR